MTFPLELLCPILLTVAVSDHRPAGYRRRVRARSRRDDDPSSPWLIPPHCDSLSRLAGVIQPVSRTPLKAELVESRGLPDGVLGG